MKFHKISPVGTELVHVDGLKDGRIEQAKRQKLIVPFRNSAKAPKLGRACGLCGFGGEA
jgi:hypothetical protein